MSENSKKIRELAEAMRAEGDISIHNRVMVVLGILEGYLQGSPLILQTWAGARCGCGLPGSTRAATVDFRPPGKGRVSRARYGRIRRFADRFAGTNILAPRKLRNWIRGRMRVRYSLCGVRRILYLLGISSKRRYVKELSPTPAYDPCWA
ncbi:MAG: hypothetical protein OXL96_19805 [Candidatus Poribacteria bacterium]|nr:hypothetical protein [Candidatus Poribacteria bacterium]